jgi:aminoglycoside phosphotransferase (APT) family kinase protein
MPLIAKMPDDAQLPQLRVVTDPAAMKEIFQRRLPGFDDGRLQLGSVMLKRFRYTPGARCWLSYELWVKESATGREGGQFFSAFVSADGEAEAAYAEAQRLPHFQPTFGPAVFKLPELNMVLWGFPNDPRLAQLPRLLDHNAMAALFQEQWPSFDLPPEAGLAGVAAKIVKYVPQDRCTLRYLLRLKSGGERVIYGKAFAHQHHAERVFKIIRTLRQAPVCQSGQIVIPEPLFLAPALNAIFLRGLQGRNIDDNPGAFDLDRLAAEIGAALAGIHHCHLEDLPKRSDEYALAQVAEAEEVLGDFDAAYKPRLEAITGALREKYPRLTQIAPAPIHSAFRLSQMLLANGKLALIDFDDFLLGNPIFDAASFVAHLLYLPLKGKITPEQSRSAIRHFCRAYADHAAWGLPADVLAWQTAAHLVGKQAKKCVKLAKNHYRNTVDELLNLAAGILAGRLPLI